METSQMTTDSHPDRQDEAAPSPHEPATGKVETESKLIPELLCPTCLRNFRKYEWTGRETCIKISRRWLKPHVRRCWLPYTDRIERNGDLEVFCVSPKTPMKQREFAFHVAQTMKASHEVPGDLIGWYSFKSEEDEFFQPHLFIPVHQGQTAGCVIVRRKECITGRWKNGNLSETSDAAGTRWCVDKLWVFEPYRRHGIATGTVHAIANYFDIEPKDLGWCLPFTNDGEAFVRSIADDLVYLTA